MRSNVLSEEDKQFYLGMVSLIGVCSLLISSHFYAPY